MTRFNTFSRKSVPGAMAVALLLSAFPAFSGQADLKSRPMTLRECVETALKENLDLAIERLRPEMDALSLKAVREEFLPLFDLSYQNRDTNTPGTWGVEGSNFLSKSDAWNLRVTQRFNWGTSVGLGINSSMTDTTRAYTTINPSYYSNLQFDLTQPLLRGFGAAAANVDAIKAARAVQISDAALRARAFQTVYDVEESYWSLVSARENLDVQRSSLAQSRELLARNREAARIGTESGIEVLNAETEVARYEDAVLSAERAVQSREDQLKKLLNLPAGGEQRIIPVDSPAAEIRPVSVGEILPVALGNRPEMEIARRQEENSRSDVAYARNQALPRLDFNFSYWAPGISGVKYIYQDGNPLTGIVIDKIVGGRGESFTDILKGKFKNWNVNLTLEIPLAGLLSKTNLARSRAAEEQARLQLEKQGRDIEFEVQDIVRELEAKARIIAASARYRELAEKRVASETRRYQQGLVGSEWLFSYRRELANAKSSEIQAVVDYRIALARLDRIRGTSPALVPTAGNN